MSKEEINIKETIPTSSKVSFGAISFTSGFFSSLVIATSFTYFYNVKLGLTPFWTSLAWGIFIVWNMVNDPLFGFFQDRTSFKKFGRRVPYIRFGGPIYALLFIIAWFPFVPLSSQIGLFFNLLIMLYAFDTLYTLIGLISYSLPAEMAITERARSNLMIFGAIGSALSLLLSFVIPLFLLTGDLPIDQDPMIPIFRITMIIFGIFGGIILFVSSFYIKENEYATLEEPLSWKDGFIETFKNAPFLIFEVSNFSWLIAQYLLTNGVLYYVDFVLNLTGFMAQLPLLIFFIVLFIFFPIFSKIITKIGLKTTFILILFFTSGVFFLTFFIGWHFETAIISMILMGIGISGYYVTNQMIMADIIDYDEVRTGKRRETSYAGMNALLTKPTNSLSPMILLAILSVFGFISKSGATQPSSVPMGVMLAFTLIPAVAILFSGFIMLYYPLGGKEWMNKKKELHQIHQRKEEEYIEKIKEKNLDEINL
ncbi:MAG: MFS transporter [Candidatus Lokiarchaeota archaeon]